MSKYPSTIVQLFYEQARKLEPKPDEVDHVLAHVSRGQHAHWKRPPRLVVAFVGVVLLATSLGFVPAGRAAVGDLLGSLSSFFNGGSAPGRPVGADEYPFWLDQVPVGSPSDGVTAGSARIVVSSGAERLYAYREANTNAICLSLGSHMAICNGDATWWREQLASSPVYVLGPTPPDGAGKETLWGLALNSVSQIELTYKVGQPQTVTLENGGFVVAADPSRAPPEAHRP